MRTFSQEEITGLVKKLIKGDRFALSQCITLAESVQSAHQEMSQQVLIQLPIPIKPALRIAISGAPGVGKSTFIEQFGLLLIEKGYKIAVLAIDPSSTISKGSILGDKTRMQELGRQENAFIRPSPAGTTLGGVAERTKESILLCEAAGFDIILIETVGVGQSEYYAANLADFFLLLILPGAGDALQGIKRGIVEMADLIAVHKSDGNRKSLAQQTFIQYKQALHLFAPKENSWSTPVVRASSVEKTGLLEIWEMIQQFKEQVGMQALLDKRAKQDEVWLHEKLSKWVLHIYLENPKIKAQLKSISEQIIRRQLTVYEGLQKMQSVIKESTKNE